MDCFCLFQLFGVSTFIDKNMGGKIDYSAHSSFRNTESAQLHNLTAFSPAK